MARRLSPSVNISEFDKSFFVQNGAIQPTAFVGWFKWGEVGSPTLVENEQQLVNKFGEPVSTNYDNWHAAADFLQYGETLYMSRAVNRGDARNAVAGDNGLLSFELTNISGDFNNVTNVNITGITVGTLNADIISWNENTKVLIVDALSIGVDTTATATIVDAAVTPLASATSVSVNESHVLIENTEDAEAVIDSQGALSGPVSGASPSIVARYAGEMGNSLVVVAVDNGAEDINYTGLGFNLDNIENLVPKLNNINGTSTYAVNRGFAGINDLFHILVIDSRGRFSGNPGEVLERFEFVSKLSDAKNDTGESVYWRSILNDRSDYVWAINELTAQNGVPVETVARVDKVETNAIPDTTISIDSVNDYDSSDLVAAPVLAGSPMAHGERVLVIGNVTPTATEIVNGVYTWIQVQNTGEGYLQFENTSLDDIVLAKATKQHYRQTADGILPDHTDDGQVFTLEAVTSVDPYTIVTGVSENYGGMGISLIDDVQAAGDLTLMATLAGNAQEINGFVESFAGGADGSLNIDDEILLTYQEKYDNANIEIRQIIAGAASDDVLRGLVAHAELRKDVIVFASPARSTQVGLTNVDRILSNILDWKDGLNIHSSHLFVDTAWYLKFDKYADTLRWVPMNGQTAGLSALTDSNLDPWWAFAGLRRGIYRNINRLGYAPSIAHRDQLFDRLMNPVARESNGSIILYGDQTSYTQSSAFNEVGIKKLFIYVEAQLQEYAKMNLFEFNDAITRQEFVNAVTPFLQGILNRRGMEEFRVVCDKSNNTGQVIQNREFVGDIYIKPLHAIRFIQLNFVAVGTTISLNEVEL